jgi:hypothetical protein
MRIDAIALGARTNKTVRRHPGPKVDPRPCASADAPIIMNNSWQHVSKRAALPVGKENAYLHWLDTKQASASDHSAGGSQRKAHVRIKMTARRRAKHSAHADRLDEVSHHICRTMRIDTIALGARTNRTVRRHDWPAWDLEAVPGSEEWPRFSYSPGSDYMNSNGSSIISGRAPVPRDRAKRYLRWMNSAQCSDSDASASHGRNRRRNFRRATKKTRRALRRARKIACMVDSAPFMGPAADLEDS